MPTANQKRMIKHINATVFKLLNDYHFDEITIQKICDNAEINRSTFYRYFQDKYLKHEMHHHLQTLLHIMVHLLAQV